MRDFTDSTLLRIFLGEGARHHHRPLYEAIVELALHSHLTGATVLRGPMGFGHSSRLHTSKILALSADMSLVIEIVDLRPKIDAFLPQLDALITESGGACLLTLETVQSLTYP